MLKITSPESLDARAADVVRYKILLTKHTAKKDARVAEIEKQFDAEMAEVRGSIADLEADCRDYCEANRTDPDLFRDGNKSRETSLCTMGFRMSPPRVETTSRKVKWADVVTRLLRLPWGKAYVRTPAPQPDKEALLADRQRLTPEQLTAAGIQFAQDESFFLEPTPETANLGKN